MTTFLALFILVLLGLWLYSLIGILKPLPPFPVRKRWLAAFGVLTAAIAVVGAILPKPPQPDVSVPLAEGKLPDDADDVVASSPVRQPSADERGNFRNPSAETGPPPVPEHIKLEGNGKPASADLGLEASAASKAAQTTSPSAIVAEAGVSRQPSPRLTESDPASATDPPPSSNPTRQASGAPRSVHLGFKASEANQAFNQAARKIGVTDRVAPGECVETVCAYAFGRNAAFAAEINPDGMAARLVAMPRSSEQASPAVIDLTAFLALSLVAFGDVPKKTVGNQVNDMLEKIVDAGSVARELSRANLRVTRTDDGALIISIDPKELTPK